MKQSGLNVRYFTVSIDILKGTDWDIHYLLASFTVTQIIYEETILIMCSSKSHQTKTCSLWKYSRNFKKSTVIRSITKCHLFLKSVKTNQKSETFLLSLWTGLLFFPTGKRNKEFSFFKYISEGTITVITINTNIFAQQFLLPSIVYMIRYHFKLWQDFMNN